MNLKQKYEDQKDETNILSIMHVALFLIPYICIYKIIYIYLYTYVYDKINSIKYKEFSNNIAQCHDILNKYLYGYFKGFQIHVDYESEVKIIKLKLIS